MIQAEWLNRKSAMILASPIDSEKKNVCYCHSNTSKLSPYIQKMSFILGKLTSIDTCQVEQKWSFAAREVTLSIRGDNC